MTDTSHQPVTGACAPRSEGSGSPVRMREARLGSPIEVSPSGSEQAATIRALMVGVAAADRRFRHVSVVHPRTFADVPAVATTPVALAMAEAQLATNDGAMAEAIRTGLPVIVTSADRATRFPNVHSVSRRLGVDLQLAVPLMTRTRVVGALSLYTLGDGDLDVSMLDLAEALAAQAAALLELARETADLRAAMVTRQWIGQACGILMSRFVLTADEAFVALTRASQNRNIKLRELAHEVIATGTLSELEES
jgi:hypothetical protein